MLGTIVLGILVVGIVIIFTVLAFDMSTEKQEQDKPISQATNALHILVEKDFHHGSCAIYINDSILYSGRILSDTIFTIRNKGEENAIIVVDHETQKMEIADLPAQKGNYRLTRANGELQVLK